MSVKAPALLLTPKLLMLLLLLTAAATADATDFKSCTTCKGPVWSWDVFPAFLHGASQRGPGGGFDPEDLALIAKFPLVTMEKWQGAGVNPPIFEEQAWVTAATQIKKANPATTVIVWLDSFRICTCSPAPSALAFLFATGTF